jgi:uncharacterized RDD family membrane protein YckC
VAVESQKIGNEKKGLKRRLMNMGILQTIVTLIAIVVALLLAFIPFEIIAKIEEKHK